IRALGADPELPITTGEARRDAVLREDRAVEPAEHGLPVRDLHREVVVRAAPALRLVAMALRADLAADEPGVRRGPREARVRQQKKRGPRAHERARGPRCCTDRSGHSVTMSTRRFCARPSAVLLLAIGRVSPYAAVRTRL